MGFVVQNCCNPLGFTSTLIKDTDYYFVLDTDDCVVEKYLGKDIRSFKNIEIANTYRRTETQFVFYGAENFRIHSILQHEVMCKSSKKWYIKSKLSGNRIDLVVADEKKLLLYLNKQNIFATLQFSSERYFNDAFICWAETLGNTYIRVVYQLVLKSKPDTVPFNSTYRLFLYLLYRNGEFFVEKLARAKRGCTCSLESSYRVPKSDSAKLKLLPDYDLQGYIFV